MRLSDLNKEHINLNLDTLSLNEFHKHILAKVPLAYPV